VLLRYVGYLIGFPNHCAFNGSQLQLPTKTEEHLNKQKSLFN